MRRLVEIPFRLSSPPAYHPNYHQWALPRLLARQAGLHPHMSGDTTFLVGGDSLFCQYRGIGARWFISIGIRHAAEVRAMCIRHQTRDLVIRLNVEDDRLEPAIGDLVGEVLVEGGRVRVVADRYVREPEARRQCIEHHKPICQGCGFDFRKIYGQYGEGFIHIHHLVPIASQPTSYIVNPIRDLVPVCPNCHSMIHHRTPMLSMDELRALVARYRDGLTE